MARPVKHTVEYFTHDAHASQGRTLSILFNNFGHEGISAWWQLLETISDTENHVIAIRNHEDVEYLAAKTRLLPDKLKSILKKLAELEAIDPALYSEGVIWTQNFVERLRFVYDHRKQDLPSKPELSGTKTALLLPLTALLLPETPQSKVKESKVKESKEDNKLLKQKYGEFLNVFLTTEEYEKLTVIYNGSLADGIEKLSAYKKSTGKTYKDDYATLLNWRRREPNNASENRLQQGNSGSAGKPKAVDYRAGLGGPGAIIHRPS